MVYSEYNYLKGQATVVGFADDIAVVVIAYHKEEITEIGNKTIRITHKWLTETGPKLASHKTEAYLIPNKFLGITIDGRSTFKHHLGTVSDKAAKFKAALSRFIPNVARPTQRQRVL